MRNQEKKISSYIDRLNNERKPGEHNSYELDSEYEELMETVRLVKNLKEPEFPKEEFQEKLAASLVNQGKGKRISLKREKNIWFPAGVVLAAVLAVVLLINFVLPQLNTDIVYSMELAYQDVKAYHGILEVTQSNARGEVTTQSVREVWSDRNGNYYVKELEGSSKGIITVNNGTEKWQVRPDLKEVNVFAAFPDSYRFTFELGSEIEGIKTALEVRTVGEEEIAGRKAEVLSVTPKGGDTYRLWVDQETDLPLQKETALQNAIKYKVTYKSITFREAIPEELMAYSLPKDYEAIRTDSEQFVDNMEEAVRLAGFIPKEMKAVPAGFAPAGISVDPEKKSINRYYRKEDGNKKVVIAERAAEGELSPDSAAILGSVNNQKAEILTDMEVNSGYAGYGAYAELTGLSSIRWQQEGMEYAVYGELELEELSVFAQSLSSGNVVIPEKEEDFTDKPRIEVPVDLESETNEQKSVDAGHSPWKLDPAFVAQVFASLLISPEGIVGDYPIAYQDVKIVQNNGKTAIAEMNGEKTTVSRVYLKRLVRQDETGIWTVVGYDPVNK